MLSRVYAERMDLRSVDAYALSLILPGQLVAERFEVAVEFCLALAARPQRRLWLESGFDAGRDRGGCQF